ACCDRIIVRFRRTTPSKRRYALLGSFLDIASSPKVGSESNVITESVRCLDNQTHEIRNSPTLLLFCSEKVHGFTTNRPFLPFPHLSPFRISSASNSGYSVRGEVVCRI